LAADSFVSKIEIKQNKYMNKSNSFRFALMFLSQEHKQLMFNVKNILFDMF